MRPIIGVTPLWDEERDSLWMLPGYLEGIQQADGAPFVLPFSADADEVCRLVDLCDGVLLTGGQDVAPAVYGEDDLPELGEICAKRDVLEQLVLERAMERGIPVLGICRGLQFINAALGGTLYQDLPTQHASETPHRQSYPYDAPIHDVSLVEGTPLKGLLGRDSLGVNSLHHQAIKDLAPGLKAMAVSADGLIEAFYKPDYPYLWAVQWHPEFSFRVDEASRALFSSFVHAC